VIILICGSRIWDDYDKIEKRILEIEDPDGTTIIEGGARGADLMAREFALKYGIDVFEIPANWVRHGRAAGPIRNRMMLDLQPDLVIAFIPKNARSVGTKDTVNEAKRRGIPVEVIS